MTQAAWDRAAEFWALVRQAGLPTAGSAELDADAILASVADTSSQLDTTTIATNNVRYFVRFPGIDARLVVDDHVIAGSSRGIGSGTSQTDPEADASRRESASGANRPPARASARRAVRENVVSEKICCRFFFAREE